MLNALSRLTADDLLGALLIVTSPWWIPYAMLGTIVVAEVMR